MPESIEAVKLHDLIDGGTVKNLRCGPSVIACLTGWRGEKVREWINTTLRTGHRPTCAVNGMSADEMTRALQRLYPGRVVRVRMDHHRPLLHAFLAGVETYPVVVNVTGHYVIADATTVYDSLVKWGCPISEHPSRRKRVKGAWYIN